jgi:hypothetical protein
MRLFTVGLLGVVVGVLGTGCTRTFAREAVQPNPLLHPSETLRTSEKVTIVTGDMDLVAPNVNDKDLDVQSSENTTNATVAHPHRWPLINQASFTMVSRDRLRFHVQIDHKWEEWADLTTWDVHLEDDAGHTWAPASVEHPRTKLITKMWDREQRTAVCGGTGRDANGNCITTVAILDDGWKRRQTLGSLSVFRGNADFVFYQTDIMKADLRHLRLVVKRVGEAFEFNWRFNDKVADNPPVPSAGHQP